MLKGFSILMEKFWFIAISSLTSSNKFKQIQFVMKRFFQTQKYFTHPCWLNQSCCTVFPSVDRKEKGKCKTLAQDETFPVERLLTWNQISWFWKRKSILPVSTGGPRYLRFFVTKTWYSWIFPQLVKTLTVEGLKQNLECNCLFLNLRFTSNAVNLNEHCN